MDRGKEREKKDLRLSILALWLLWKVVNEFAAFELSIKIQWTERRDGVEVEFQR